jgi:lysophospholipase L1-like esterase
MTSLSIEPSMVTACRPSGASATAALLVFAACIGATGAAHAQVIAPSVPRATATPIAPRPVAPAPAPAPAPIGTAQVLSPPLKGTIMPTNFYVVTLGDSIMWGQGIPDGSKFRDLVAGWLQTQFGATRRVVQIPTHAHSGARILPKDGVPDVDTPHTGEFPNNGAPSLYEQTALTAADLSAHGISPASVNLVLLDGGINDIGITFLLDPLKSTGDIDQYTQALCIGRMQALLPQVIQTFPNAAIVVTGYFQIVTSESDTLALSALLAALGIQIGGPVGGLAGLVGGVIGKDQLVANSGEFAVDVYYGLTTVVQQTNAQYGPTVAKVALASPGFGDPNGYHASSTYLWDVGYFAIDEGNGVAGVNPPTTYDTHSVAWNRARECAMASTPPDPTCVDASMGHPNLDGEAAYAAAIEAQLAGPLAARVGLPPPPPPPFLQMQISSGVDNLGPTVRMGAFPNPPQLVKLTHWMNVSAVSQKGVVRGGTVSVQRTAPGQTAFGSGAIGTKFYYRCVDAYPPPPSLHAAGPITVGGPVGCTGVANIPGFPEQIFGVNGDPPPPR